MLSSAAVKILQKEAVSGWSKVKAQNTIQSIQRNLPVIILCLILFILMMFLYKNTIMIGRMLPDFSLRYDNEITGDTAKESRLYSIDSDEEDSFWPTFWREDTYIAESDTGNAPCTAISFSGDGALVWNADFLRGVMPGVTDNVGCALSDELALSLYGSMDIVGMEVEINDDRWIIRGVFNESQPLALLSVGDETRSVSWQAVELGEGPEDANKNTAENFSISSGLGRPSVVFAGESFVILSNLTCFAAVIILAGFVIIRLLRLLQDRVRGFVIFGICIAVAFMLPAILRLLPGWIIPDMWSDFSHWTSLYAQYNNDLRDLLGNAPFLRDVEGKLLLFRQGVLLFASTVCAVSVCFMYGRKSNGEHNA